jgi:hypothetical protein
MIRSWCKTCMTPEHESMSVALVFIEGWELLGHVPSSLDRIWCIHCHWLMCELSYLSNLAEFIPVAHTHSQVVTVLLKCQMCCWLYMLCRWMCGSYTCSSETIGNLNRWLGQGIDQSIITIALIMECKVKRQMVHLQSISIQHNTSACGNGSWPDKEVFTIITRSPHHYLIDICQIRHQLSVLTVWHD